MDSVRLEVGGALGNRIDGDSLELTIPQDDGVATVQLEPGSEADYAEAVQQVRDCVARDRRQAQARRVRDQRAATTEITRIATAYQKALGPKSPDDPCRYMTSQLVQEIIEVWGGSSCKKVGSSGNPQQPREQLA